MATIFDNPIYAFIAIPIAITIILLILFRGKLKHGISFKDFKSRGLAETFMEELKSKVDLTGIVVKKATLFMGFRQIGRIERYKIVKGKFSKAYFDDKTKSVAVDPEGDTEYDLMIMRSKNNFFIYRWLGMKKHYFIFKYHENEKKIVEFDPLTNRFFININMDLVTYGNVWTNSEESIEYLNNISQKRMNEETMMHLENLPDKIVHLELEQAKKERTGRLFTDLERSKYEERKTADDTVIS